MYSYSPNAKLSSGLLLAALFTRSAAPSVCEQAYSYLHTGYEHYCAQGRMQKQQVVESH